MRLASVIIVDDDQFVLTTLKHALTGLSIEVNGVTSTASGAMELIKRFEVDVAILDLDLGLGASGIDVAYALREQQPSLGIVLLTSFSDPRVLDPSSREMPKGSIFLTKSRLTNMSILISAILWARKNPLKKSPKKFEPTTLTNRQLEVLKLLSEGMSTGEISSRLEVSEKAIEAMITKLYSVFEVENTKTINKRVRLARAYFSLSGKKFPGG
jgi:DNA-binding NarL/FixJ family response regulator